MALRIRHTAVLGLVLVAVVTACGNPLMTEYKAEVDQARKNNYR